MLESLTTFTTSIVKFSADVAVESLKKFKNNENRLENILKNKIETDQELSQYLKSVVKASDTNINYIDKLVKKNTLSSRDTKLVSKLSELYNKQLCLEIDGESRKSPEVSINILHNAHSSVNNKLRELDKQKKELLVSDATFGNKNMEFIAVRVDNQEEIVFEYAKGN